MHTLKNVFFVVSWSWTKIPSISYLLGTVLCCRAVIKTHNNFFLGVDRRWGEEKRKFLRKMFSVSVMNSCRFVEWGKSTFCRKNPLHLHPLDIPQNTHNVVCKVRVACAKHRIANNKNAQIVNMRVNTHDTNTITYASRKRFQSEILIFTRMLTSFSFVFH